jgi:hypothetical protein
MRMADKIIMRPVESLIPYARNARTHSEAQVAQIAGSIREFGFTNPLPVDGENGIIAGHGRVLVARLLGMVEVPCIELSHLTPAQRRAYIIADNKLALNAGWDQEQLKIELGELSLDGFDLSLTGFDEAELAGLLNKTEGRTDGPMGGVRQFTGDRSRKWRPIFGLWYPQQVCDEPAAGRQDSKSATMGGRAGKRRRIRRSGASRRPAAAPLYARWPAGFPRHRPPAMKRIFARSRRQGRPLPAALCTGRGATFVRLR